MTPIQTTYLARLHATAEANLAFFEKNTPDLHRLLIREGPSATIDISDQGDLTIRLANGDSRPVAEAMLAVEDKLVEFADLKRRPQLLAFHNLRAVLLEPGHGDMQRYHYSNLDAEYPNRVRRHFAQHYPDNTGLHRYPEFGEKTIPLVIVLGSDLGWHLTRLVTEYHIDHLIVIDVDVDAFRQSLFFQDYVMLSRLAMERGTNMTFIVQPDMEQVSYALMGVLKQSMPPFFIHGAALFTAMTDVETAEEIKAAIVNTLWELFFGLGYFDDELISIKHTFANLKGGLPIYLQPNCIPEDAVAFVVGSGPSLDGLLPLLREYGDRAVVLSCGTALSALAHAGIRPDFHFEKERPYIVHEVLTKTVGEEFLKDISFIGLNVVHPDVFALFRDGGIVMKAADVMSLLLAQAGIDRQVILNTQPTVTNMAVDVALSMGFRQVYLFGVDMGYKDKERHHSQHTAYLNKMPEADHLKRLLSKRPDSGITLPGNFDGEVSTNKILFMARQHMGHAITRHPQASVYNLNDGAEIMGALPLHPEDFSCDATPDSRTSAMEAIRGAFQPRQFDHAALSTSLLDQIDQFMQDALAILAEESADLTRLIDKIKRLYLYVMTGPVTTQPTGLLFRGIVLHLLSLTYNAITIIKDQDEALAKAEFDFGNLEDFLEQARDEVVRVLYAESESHSRKNVSTN